eukprot:CAMPEP_0170564122 /NCGR_PEP_ID=MMETSP0211-20121228/71153_1 /TAXON_ID=311385 /ORGANISM="Pseudokeronopsis sp., Strain OXSARD2" /LENGTH=63 /DNA_ID=CAMNT_0010883205 /DNA_START=40 /DNA_END=228 /DNA_ORIENTATION=-
MGMGGLAYLKRILQEPTTLLGHIYLASNYIGNKGLALLAEGLADNHRVVDLDLQNNEIQGKQG